MVPNRGIVKLAFVERAGTRDRDLNSSQAAIVTASQMEERATSELSMMRRSHQVTANERARRFQLPDVSNPHEG